ncbi:MAG: hypothetical protein HC923_04425 [Myxococcales bacterium]|nr:hypothetical protein [Myxococcales bacterium]
MFVFDACTSESPLDLVEQGHSGHLEEPSGQDPEGRVLRSLLDDHRGLVSAPTPRSTAADHEANVVTAPSTAYR